jgi:bacteriorhodopsin
MDIDLQAGVDAHLSKREKSVISPWFWTFMIVSVIVAGVVLGLAMLVFGPSTTPFRVIVERGLFSPQYEGKYRKAICRA